jgi:hypothetical protein
MALRTAHRPDRHGTVGYPAEDVIEFSDRIPEILHRTGKHDDYLDVPLLTHVKKRFAERPQGSISIFWMKLRIHAAPEAAVTGNRLPHAAAKATEATAPETTEASTAASRRIRGRCFSN